MYTYGGKRFADVTNTPFFSTHTPVAQSFGFGRSKGGVWGTLWSYAPMPYRITFHPTPSHPIRPSSHPNPTPSYANPTPTLVPRNEHLSRDMSTFVQGNGHMSPYISTFWLQNVGMSELKC